MIHRNALGGYILSLPFLEIGLNCWERNIGLSVRLDRYGAYARVSLIAEIYVNLLFPHPIRPRLIRR